MGFNLPLILLLLCPFLVRFSLFFFYIIFLIYIFSCLLLSLASIFVYLSLHCLSLPVQPMCSGQQSVCLCVLRNLSTCSSWAKLFFSSVCNGPNATSTSIQVSLSIPQPVAAPTRWRRSRKTSRITMLLWSVVPRYCLPTVRPRSDTHHPCPLLPTHSHTTKGTDVVY